MSDQQKQKEAMEARDFVKKFFELISNSTLSVIKKFLKNQNKSIEDIINNTIEGRGRMAIHFAAARCDKSIFDYFYELTTNKEQQDNEGSNVLFIATQHDQLDFVQYLHTKGYSLLTKRKGNVSLLHVATTNGNIPMMEFLIKNGLDIEETSDDLGTPLSWAIAYSQVESAKYLISKKANLISRAKNMPPGIHLAINAQCQPMVDLLLSQGEEVFKSQDGDGWSTLHIAAEIGNVELCKRLVDKVDPNYKVKGQTALELAFMHDHMDCVNFLKDITQHGELVKPVVVPLKIPTEEEKQTASNIKDEGNKFFQEQKYEEAIEKYKQAIEMNPQNEVFYSNLSACYFNQKDYQNALEQAQISKKLNNQWPKSCFREAEAFLHLGNFCDAAASFWEALKLDPNNKTYKQGFDHSVKMGKKQFNNQK